MTTIRNPHLPYDETRWRPSTPETCERKHRFGCTEDAYAEREKEQNSLVFMCQNPDGGDQ